MSDENETQGGIDAFKGIVDSGPVHEEVLPSVAGEPGKGLLPVAKTIHAALAPVSALVWGFEQVRDFVYKRVGEKLNDVPKERIATPSPSVAGPALEALRYAGHDPDLREMYANLLAQSMDAATARSAHPAFVEIIKQLSPDEAKLLRWMAANRVLPVITVKATEQNSSGSIPQLVHFSLLGYQAGCTFPELTASYLTNICRLGLGNIPTFGQYTTESYYEPLLAHPHVQAFKAHIEQFQKKKFDLEKLHVAITPLGNQFFDSCVIEKKRT